MVHCTFHEDGPCAERRHAAGGMHPCALEEGKCCGGHNYGAAVIRFTSHFHAEGARVMLAYDVYPYCGDGLDLVVTHNFVASYRGRAVLLQQRYAPLKFSHTMH